MNKPEFNEIRNVGRYLKDCLEKDFGYKYITFKKMASTSNGEDIQSSLNILEYFRIKKVKDPVYSGINSEKDVDEIKVIILDQYKLLINNFYDLFERVEGQLKSDPDVVKGLEIIGKSLQNREKKMKSAFERFRIEDSWDIDRIREEYSHVLQNIFQSILQQITNSIYSGIQFNSVYEDIILLMNKFFQEHGVYTHEYEVGYELEDHDYNHLDISTNDSYESKDMSKKDTIAEVNSLAYLFDEEVVILEGQVIVWKIS